MTNSFVQYLTRFYTGGSAHEGVFDEYNLKEETFGSALDVVTAVEGRILEHFSSPLPSSLILTGNAGDGKTRICRMVVEQLTGEPLVAWPEHAVPYIIDCEHYQLKVIKDLSDFDEKAARTILSELDDALTLPEADRPTVFLIAANEGKLRHTAAPLRRLNYAVKEQLTQGAIPQKAGVVVYNLNLERTSQYVASVLQKMTAPELWRACDACSARSTCPIRFNQERLNGDLVQNRMTTLYEIVEQAGHHITLRDMLIHLTHTLVGTLNCDAVLSRHLSLSNDLWRNAYYQNCWAVNDSEQYRRALAVVNHLDNFMIGQVSDYDIDSFILHGGESAEQTATHATLLGSGVDLGGDLFARQRTRYRSGQMANTNEAPAVLSWLPHCRRKLYFEWKDPRFEALIPFQSVQEFRTLVADPEGLAIEGATRRLILGLNRAFTGLYLNVYTDLYVTSHYTGSREQPVPVIKATVPYNIIDLAPWPEQSSDRLLLSFRTGTPAPTLEIDQLLYEYLIRLAEGGTRNILAEECELRVRSFKEELLASTATFAALQSKHLSGMLRFFSQTDNGYVEQRVVIQPDGKVKVKA